MVPVASCVLPPTMLEGLTLSEFKIGVIVSVVETRDETCA
jgi:pyruvoyl-dependent arginine decarboxylase (PvlArgDC)